MTFARAASADCDSKLNPHGVAAASQMVAPFLDLGSLEKVYYEEKNHELHFIPKGPIADQNEKGLLAVIGAATKWFELIRGWQKQFSQERIALAEKYATQSEYVYTVSTPLFRQEGIRQGEITGTLGVTIARYGNGLPDGSPNELLTMEESHQWSLERPRLADGKLGKIFEMRTYSMHPDVGSEPFGLLWAGMNEILQRELKESPELAKLKVVFTYGDEKSFKMYRKMGFKLADPARYPPVNHLGQLWHAYVASPEEMLQNYISRIRKYEVSTGLPSVTVETAGGRTFVAKGDKIRMAGKFATQFTLAKPTEFLPGLWLKESARILTEDEAGQTFQLDGVESDPLAAENSLVETMELNHKPFVAYYSAIKKEVILHEWAGVKAATGSALGVLPDHLLISVLDENFNVDPIRLPGVIAKKGGGLEILRKQEFTFYRIRGLAQEVEIEPGLYAHPNGTVEIKVYDDGRKEAILVQPLSRPFVSSTGRVHFPGMTFSGLFNQLDAMIIGEGQ